MKYIVIALSWCVVASCAEAANIVPAQLSGLSDAEKSYYEKVFDYTMDVIKPNENYTWKSYEASGNITPGESFVSKSKAACRTFSETFSMDNKTESAEGVACKRDGNDGWCRLKKDNALTCAMESPANIVQAPAFDGSTPTAAAPDATVSRPDAPNVNTGNMRRVDKPSGNDVADTVTGTAGNAGRSGAHALSNWFSSTFR